MKETKHFNLCPICNELGDKPLIIVQITRPIPSDALNTYDELICEDCYEKALTKQPLKPATPSDPPGSIFKDNPRKRIF